MFVSVCVDFHLGTKVELFDSFDDARDCAKRQARENFYEKRSIYGLKTEFEEEFNEVDLSLNPSDYLYFATYGEDSGDNHVFVVERALNRSFIHQ